MIKPVIQGDQYAHYDGRYRIWTVNDAPFGTFPRYEYGSGAAMVPHTSWCVSTTTLNRALSSPSVVAADDGKVRLNVHRPSHATNPDEQHPLDGTRYNTPEDADRAAYEAGVLACMVYLRDEQRFGLSGDDEPFTHIPVGPRRTLQPVAQVRTPEQRAAVQALTARPDFDYVVINPFSDLVRAGCDIPFKVQWFDTSGNLHVRRIGKRGNTLSEY